MHSVTNFILWVVVILVVLLAVGWLGFSMPAGSYPPHSEHTGQLHSLSHLTNLPEPVYKLFVQALGKDVPEIQSAVVWGKAKVKISGLWMPARFKSYYVAGQEFSRFMEVTWYGLSVLKMHESYAAGLGRVSTEGLFGESEDGMRVDQSLNIAMWADAMLMPSIYVSDARITWKAVDRQSARLVVPLIARKDSLAFRFNSENAMIVAISAECYRDQQEWKTPILVTCERWRTFHGIKIPSRFSVAWQDEDPWAYYSVEGVEYNVNVSENIPGAFPIPD